jgi:segregation and condensation protein A
VLERLKTRPVLSVNEEGVTVGHMIQFMRQRLVLEDRPVRLKQLLRSLNSRNALVCAFLAMLELVRLQAVLLRQDRVFGDILIRKHTAFDAIMADAAAARDDWK